jgi:hypothetical protein
MQPSGGSSKLQSTATSYGVPLEGAGIDRSQLFQFGDNRPEGVTVD